MATGLDALLAGDVVSFFTNTTRGDLVGGTQALIGIVCGDKLDRASSLDEIRPGIAKYEQMSMFSDTLINYHGFDCARWRFAAKERYTGNFNVKTKRPLLFVGNTFDPVTPYISAKNMSLSFEGSVFLQSNIFGVRILSLILRGCEVFNSDSHAQHSTLSGHTSKCIEKAIFDYFDTGALPKPDTVCEPDMPIFTKDMLIPLNAA